MLGPLPLLFFLLFYAPQEASVEIQTTGATGAVEGQWVGLAADGLTIQRDGQKQLIGMADLQSARFPKDAEVNDQANSQIIVRMNDGSRVQPRSLSSNGQEVQLELAAGTSVNVPAIQIRSVQLQKLSDVQRTQWEAMLDSRMTSDTLVMVRSTDSLDKIEGIIGEISQDQVVFDFGGQKINAPRAKLAGLRFFSPPVSPPTIGVVVMDIYGNQWNASQLDNALGSSSLEVSLSGGSRIQLPLSAVMSIDWSLGSIKYLADLTPLNQQRRGGIELKIPIPGSDQLFGAQPLRLPQTSGASLRFLGCGSVTYRVPADYSRLAGTVYLAPDGNRFTACSVQVKLENETVWEAELSHPSQRVELAVPIQPDSRLQLSVVSQVEHPVGDAVVWQELRLMK